MKFWDSSAIVPLLVQQRVSDRAAQLFENDSELVVWWAARVECISALARLEREGSLKGAALLAALDRLHQFANIWDEVQPTDALRATAERLLRVHALRAADAFQLAAMVELAGGDPRGIEVICFDDRLGDAVMREGFRLVGAEH